MKGILYVVATPIGNLGDITVRALEVLKSSDVVLAEDTRVSKKLLKHYEIETKIKRFDAHSTDKQFKDVLKSLEEGDHIALITDAGTPCISDPGALLVKKVIEELPETQVIPIPGASSLTTAISASGVLMPRFTFLGFLPQKKGRNKFIDEIKESALPVVLFESPHRILKFLTQLEDKEMGDSKIVLGRELTKLYEEFLRGTVSEVKKDLESRPSIKGEFVVIIER
jgi:16S rRNA (cytidine1402-2'-O)-methyltransferase